MDWVHLGPCIIMVHITRILIIMMMIDEDDDIYDGDDDDDSQSARAEICVGGTRADYHYDYDRDDFDH